ncbi:class II lanthipeptide, LchA2/BrtA2 family [Streptomyces sp. ME19-01-6]|uniref:class II lanthipeptide, LchA2/BrtA2 family n=1 Tax=Streptomyces sp. ME19-01-6 TaxID=3028686 RepID=UPI0029B085F9|nr:class II lanthipeptide, LchA2/BrtA2 family [Streptomyces sp. ME19-01-6]MDX3229892.1 class II lanthipeptide, LchA2/BrtA2 family [Streptomyces sp. ME19-01-6]
MDQDTNILGAWDEAELVELSEADTHGGTGPVCVLLGITGIAAGVSAAVCPTTKCTSRC